MLLYICTYVEIVTWLIVCAMGWLVNWYDYGKFSSQSVLLSHLLKKDPYFIATINAESLNPNQPVLLPYLKFFVEQKKY